MSGYGQGGALTGEARPSWPAARARSWLGRASTRDAAYRLTVLALILLGVYFRSRRYWIDPLGLWMDEAQWGMRLFDRHLTQLEFRPIGYMALTKLIVSVYSDERSLRLLSYLAGIASVLIAANLSAHAFKSRGVRVLCVAVVAYQPLLIDMAREFKPYSLEFCVHLTLIWLFVRWRSSGARAWLYALLACAVLAFPLAYNVAFLLPALFTLVGYVLVRQKRYPELLGTACAALVTLASMGAIYTVALHSSTHDTDSSTQFWGKKYDAFFLAKAHERHPGRAHAGWLAHKYLELAELPGSHGNRPIEVKTRLTDATRELGELGAPVWLVLHVLGLAALLRYYPERGVLLLSPLLLSAAFNVLGLWPFGAFRGNVFLLAYVILIPMSGLDALLSAPLLMARLLGVVGSVFLFVANVSAGFEPHGRKHFFSSQTEMTSLVTRMGQLRSQQPSALQRQRVLVVLDTYGCTPFSFESRYNDGARRKFGSFLTTDVNVQCATSAAAAEKLLTRYAGQPFFAVISDERQMPGYSSMLSSKANITDHERIRGSQDLYFGTVR